MSTKLLVYFVITEFQVTHLPEKDSKNIIFQSFYFWMGLSYPCKSDILDVIMYYFQRIS